MLWALPSILGAGHGAYTGYKKGGIPGAIGGALWGAIPWSKWKAAGMGLGFLKDWLNKDENNVANASYVADPKASQFAQNFAANLGDQAWSNREASPGESPPYLPLLNVPIGPGAQPGEAERNWLKEQQEYESSPFSTYRPRFTG